MLGTLPLAAGYLVLASRHGAVHTPDGQPLRTPPTLDTVHQAFANFFGVPRADAVLTPTGLYAIAIALLVLIGLALAARRNPAHGVLLALLLVLPPLVIAFVQVPGTDNHVRYVIEALPSLLVCLAHGGVELGRRISPPAALAVGAALALVLPVVDLDRGRHLADYRYRGVHSTATRQALDGAAAWMRQRFARDDVVFGYDPVWGNAVLHAGGNAALKDARGTARAEGPLIVRSLDRLHGPVAHGWYVALVRRPGRSAGLPRGARQRLRGAPLRRLRGRAHDRAVARPHALRAGCAAGVRRGGCRARRPAGADDRCGAQCRRARRPAMIPTRRRSAEVSQPVASSTSGKSRPISRRPATGRARVGQPIGRGEDGGGDRREHDDAPALVAHGEDALAAHDHQHRRDRVRGRRRRGRAGRPERRDQDHAEHRSSRSRRCP